MIILLTGDNLYGIDHEVGTIVDAYDGHVEQLDAAQLQPRDLTDIFTSLSLFGARRLVVIRRLSEQADAWEALAAWAPKDSDTTLVLVEPSVDKRTKTYKALVKNADVRSFAAWGERDTAKAERWLMAEAKRRAITIDSTAVREIVRRRGVEQYQLINTLEQLAVLGDITPNVVERHIEATPSENVFALLGAALAGDSMHVRSMIQTLRLTNDPYMTMGLLASQAFALSGLVFSGKSPSEVAKDISVSPYVLRNFSSVVDSIDRSQLRSLIKALAEADIGLKSSGVDPWLQIEGALAKQ